MERKIRELLKQRKAILLSHNYQPPVIQDIADICGDSLELSIRAAQTDADVIVFCGVHFMAETASILCPGKTVLLPRQNAGCPMADMITAEALSARKAELPGVPVVTYVNSPASVKALSTICCTSANAVKVANSLNAPEILMTPDRNLARFVESRTGITIHTWPGFCPIHDAIRREDAVYARQKHPLAVLMAHPECRMEVLALADEILSTSGMLRYAKTSRHSEFIVGTEIGLLYTLQKENPDKRFYPISAGMECPDMKKIGLADIVRVLETLEGEVRVPEDIRKPAYEAVKRMIDQA
ncbi:MAG: quinolinate synthase NadA [Desulfatirhabdiaceae bacterium]